MERKIKGWVIHLKWPLGEKLEFKTRTLAEMAAYVRDRGEVPEPVYED